MKHNSILYCFWALITIQCLLNCSCEKGSSTTSPGPVPGPATGSKPESVNPSMPKGIRVVVDISPDETEGVLNERYVGYALDTAQITNGLWWSDDRKKPAIAGTPDLQNPKIRKLASYLAPSRLRIGGTSCDGVYVCPEEGTCTLPPEYRDTFSSSDYISTVLTHEKIRLVADFAEAVDARVMWCISMGAGPRNEHTGAWIPDNAGEFIRYVESLPNGYLFDIWEAGNEVDFLNIHQKLKILLTPKRYGKDLQTFRAMVEQNSPGKDVAGPGGYFLPLPIFRDLNFTQNLAKESLNYLDWLSWHLYATQSDRCPFVLFPSTIEGLFSKAVENNSRKMAQYVKNAADGVVPVMNGESASCQCGGQIGVSDNMIDALWWADWIGIMAQEGTNVIVRQTLVGSDYGMLDMGTYNPRPTFLVDVMYRRMVNRFRFGTAAIRDEIRAHGYCSARTPGAVIAVLVNPTQKTLVANLGLKGNAVAEAEQWTIGTGGDVSSKVAAINCEKPLEDGTIPYPPGDPVHCEHDHAFAKVDPFSIVFVELIPAQDVAMCH